MLHGGGNETVAAMAEATSGVAVIAEAASELPGSGGVAVETGPFGLLRNPFERSAELDDGCLPNTIASLLSELQSGLRSPQGLSVLVGTRGSGKSFAASAFAR